MKKIIFYIGSNNQTKELEKDKALNVFSKYFDGLNVKESSGLWKGESERTLEVSIFTEIVQNELIENICKEINSKLDQQAVLVEILESNAQFISSR